MYEYYIKFKEKSWYTKNKESIREIIFELPCFFKREKHNEYWLVEKLNLKEKFGFEVIIYLEEENILLTILNFKSKPFFEDVKNFINILSQKTEIYFVNDDGEVYDYNN